MKDDFLSVFEEKESTFSKGQKRISAYIKEAYDKAAFMTASKLGAAVGVSESTVVRFAVELGFDGYPEMQKAMQEMVMNRLTAVQRIEVANNRIGSQDVLSKVLQADAEKLRQTSETINREHFQAAVEVILKARRIYVLGVRSAAALANFAGYYMNHMFDNVHVMTTSGAGELFENLVGIHSDDVVLAFSFPRYSTAVAKVAQYCRSIGATVIGITNTALSPLGQSSDYVLTAKSDMVSLVDSLVAPLSVVNALLVALTAAREQTVQSRLETLESVWEEYNIYEKRVDNP